MTSNSEILSFVIITTIMILGLMVFTIIILLLYQKKQVGYLQHLESLKVDHENNLLQTQLEIQEQTFQNISREIHDNIGLSLTLAKLNLNMMQFENLERSKEVVISVVDLISKSINDLSDISKSLNSEAISHQGFLNALQVEMDRLRKLNRFKIDFEVTGQAVYFDSQKELVLFRIVQEGLNNIIKHSDAQNIYLEVNFDKIQIRLLIRDNGKGFCQKETEKSVHRNMKAGLVNMKMRAKLINGDMKIESNLGEGTTIIVTAPIL